MGLEGLNTSLQGRGKTVGGMLSAVACVKKHFQSQRTEEAFITVYTSATDLVTSLDIEPIKMPHLRKPQRRHAGPAEPYVPSTDQEYYRVQFFQVLDIVTTQLTKRFEQEGLQHLVKLEKVLLSGQVDDVVDLYPELQFPVPKGAAGHVHCQLHLQNLLRSDRNHEEHGSRGPWSLQSS